MEELGVWASNRAWIIEDSLRPEQGWNVGVNVTSKFKLLYRDADLAIDGYWTEFQNRAVVDLDANAHEVRISNLNSRESRSLTAQAELGWSVHRRWDMRLAYRFVHATTERTNAAEQGTLMDPYVPRHRAFTQWSYSSKPDADGRLWNADFTVQWVGPQRIPRPDANFDDRLPSEFEPDFVVVNGQLSRVFAPGVDLYFRGREHPELQTAEPHCRMGIGRSGCASVCSKHGCEPGLWPSLWPNDVFGWALDAWDCGQREQVTAVRRQPCIASFFP